MPLKEPIADVAARAPETRTPASTAAPLLSLRNVSVEFSGHAVLEGIDLDIRRGEFLCVVGSSGCGKTTMLRLASGLLQPTSGTVSYQGQPMLAPRPDIAIVFQDYSRALLPWRTAASNVSLALEARGMPSAQRASRIHELLTTMGLQGHADKFPGLMSGGMQQRLQIARCLAQEPVLLLMDEPFGALDAMTRSVLQDEILRLVAGTGTTVFFVTHDLEEALYLGDRVIAMKPNPGRITETFKVTLPRPRNQLTTREDPEFLRLRRVLFDFIRAAEA